MRHQALKARTALAIVATLFALHAQAVVADDAYPTRQIEMITPYPPGGVADTSIRVVLPFLAKELGDAAIIPINRPGAGGQVAAGFVMRAPADGYTIFNAGAALFTTARALSHDKLGFTIDDFVTIGSFGSDPTVMVVSKNAPYKTMDEFVKYAKANPDKVSAGDGGLGGLGHFLIEALNLHYGLDITAVHHQGAGPLLPQVLGGHLPMVTAGVTTFMDAIKSGDVIPLVIAQKHPDLPNVPSAAELGANDLGILSGIQTIVVAKQTPPPIVAKLAAALKRATSDPAFLAGMAKVRILPTYEDQKETLDDLARQHEFAAKLVKRAGIEVK